MSVICFFQSLLFQLEARCGSLLNAMHSNLYYQCRRKQVHWLIIGICSARVLFSDMSGVGLLAGVPVVQGGESFLRGTADD